MKNTHLASEFYVTQLANAVIIFHFTSNQIRHYTHLNYNKQWTLYGLTKLIHIKWAKINNGNTLVIQTAIKSTHKSSSIKRYFNIDLSWAVRFFDIHSILYKRHLWGFSSSDFLYEMVERTLLIIQITVIAFFLSMVTLYLSAVCFPRIK